MKKTLLAALFAAVAIVGGYKAYSSQTETSMLSDLAKANVEALAESEQNNPNKPVIEYYLYPCPELYRNFCRSKYEEYRPLCYQLSFCN